MSRSNSDASLNRRDFTRLTAAALTGMTAGVIAGCGKRESGSSTTPVAEGAAKEVATAAEPVKSATEEIEQTGVEYDEALLLSEPHVCCGLNLCKGHGACKTANNDCKGQNACAGQGKCASAEKHVCSGMNDCKGQGGCGEHPGMNSCSEKGACAVPLKPDKWAKTRAKFEELYKVKHDKTPGPAPEDCGKKA